MAGPTPPRGSSVDSSPGRTVSETVQFTVTLDGNHSPDVPPDVRAMLADAPTVDATGDPNPVAVVAVFLDHDRRSRPASSAGPRTSVIRLDAARRLVVVTTDHAAADTASVIRALTGSHDRGEQDRPPVDTSPIHLGTTDVRALSERAAHLGVTPVSLLQAVWAVTLGHPTTVSTARSTTPPTTTRPTTQPPETGDAWLSVVVDHTDALNARVGHHRDRSTAHHRDRLVAALLDGTVRSALRPEARPEPAPPPEPAPRPE
ncbi:hypothetical protein, partial [Rhodococcoides corynebacterioides]|uniref:hypothetical protein n=1 Tax=Rhodococcoides corynebacterioides TaxID=53972 RepID=UPI001C9B1AC6